MERVEKILLFIAMIAAVYYNLRSEILFSVEWIFEVLITLLFALFCISLHGFIQSFFAIRAGDINQKIEGYLTLNPLKFVDLLGLIPFLFFGFGWAKPIKSEKALKGKLTLQRLGIIFSGVALNLILGFVFALLVGPSENISLTLAAILKLFSKINIYYGLFSLIPIPPLDGWLIFMSLLRRNVKTNSFELYGKLVIIILLGSDILPKLVSYTGNYIFFILNI